MRVAIGPFMLVALAVAVAPTVRATTGTAVQSALTRAGLTEAYVPNGLPGLTELESVRADKGGVLILEYEKQVLYESRHALVLEDPNSEESLPLAGLQAVASDVRWDTFQQKNAPARHALTILLQNGMYLMVIPRETSSPWSLSDIRSFVQSLKPIS